MNPRPVQTRICPGCNTVHDLPLCPPRVSSEEISDYTVMVKCMRNGRNAFVGLSMRELGERHIFKAGKPVGSEPSDSSAGTTRAPNSYRPSYAERERSEEQGDRIAMFRREI
jgi:hypothetical protein